MSSHLTSPARSHRARGLVAALASVALLGALAGPARAADPGPGVNPVGSGSYLGTTPGATPKGCPAVETDPRSTLTADAPTGALPTNDWWSSLLFKKWECRTSAPLYAHPVAYQPTPAGLGLSTPRTAVLSGTSGGIGEFHYPYAEDVVVGVSGLDAPVVKVAGWSDWTVTPAWEGDGKSLRATIGHGLPFSWYHLTGGDAVLSATQGLTVWWRSGGAIGFTANGHDYAAFAPTGSTWTTTATRATSSLAGSGFLSVVALPTAASASDAARTAAAQAYQPYAFAEVTGTQATYVYDEANAVVRTTYALTTVARQGTERRSVVALYPHQQRYVTATGGTKVAAGYASPRGAMTAYAGVQAFTTSTPFTGVLPEVPAVATGSGAARTQLVGLLEAATSEALPIPSTDTYWTGKALGKATRLAEIADQLGRTDLRDRLLAGVRTALTDWFTASPGKTAQVFAYDRRWGTLIGYPASYGSDEDLNDHHFHYGYFVAAAATLARFDPQWAQRYGGMVELLVRDANGYDRADPLFPYLRDFDVYAGHDWASGHGGFGAGNNQESSSEGMNYAGALLLWGEATGDRAARDAGAYLYATQAAAIQDYWFDGAQAIPAGFGHSTVGMIWGDGGAYATWFSGEPEMIQGINTLPVTGAHLYLGLRPADVRANYAELVAANGGEPGVWQDILWSYLALGDPAAALAKLDANPGYAVEEGESRAHTRHWIANLTTLGTLDTSVHADHALAAVFTRGGARTYVAANVTSAAMTVTFSDGRTVAVPAGRTVAVGASTWSGGSAPGGPGGGGPTPTPTPTPSATPTASPTPTPTASPTPTPTASPTPTPTPTPTTPTSLASLYLDPSGVLTSTAPTGGRIAVAGSTGLGDDLEEPSDARVFTLRGVTAATTGQPARFDLAVDAGMTVGSGTRVSIAYDLTGDGTWDRTEVYRYFATDPVPGDEHYTEAVGLVRSSGTLGALTRGTVRVAVWNAIGSQSTSLDARTSVLHLPLTR